jgi:hypothetical protein
VRACTRACVCVRACVRPPHPAVGVDVAHQVCQPGQVLLAEQRQRGGRDHERVNGQLVNGQWSMVNDQWSSVNSQRSTDRGHRLAGQLAGRMNGRVCCFK